jgi:3-hydroxyisobutyrate dehydrogenase-like beta-hydroxyacid dehydrogenase
MSRRTQRNIGIIGLGIIGSRVREVLRRKGFHVFVWNRTPRPVPNFVGAPVELAEMCDYLQIFVSDDDALLEVAKQLSPGLTARHIVLVHSTVAPHSIAAAAEIVERRGARFVEAPFTGSKTAAEKGELVYYVAGDEAALREARPVLEASSKEIIEMGAVGQATVVKIATNMITAATVQAAAEAMALVQAAGIPLEKFLKAMEGNSSHSATLAMKLPKMIEGKFDPYFSIKHMLKDVQIAARLGLTQHLELGVTSAARDRLLEQMQRGHGEEDYSAIVRKYFPDVPSPSQEADLELFEPRPPVMVLDVPSHNDLANGNQAGAVIAPVVAEIPGPKVEPDILHLAPIPESLASEPKQVANERVDEATVSESAPTLTEHVAAEEAQPRRGFLSRLLQRGVDY